VNGGLRRIDQVPMADDQRRQTAALKLTSDLEQENEDE